MLSRIAVFASGSGSNFEAICKHLDSLGAARGGDVALVLADRAQAGVLARATARAIPTVTLDRSDDTDRIAAHLTEHHVDLIVLAGYLKLVPTAVTQRFRGRMLNVHPALLPAFGGPGMFGKRVHAAVLASGARVSGVTAHFVDEVYDNGPIIAQWPVPVFRTDSPDSLAARVLEVEHLLYPRVVHAVAAGRVRLDADGVVRRVGGPTDTGVPFTRGAIESGALASQIDTLIGE